MKHEFQTPTVRELPLPRHPSSPDNFIADIAPEILSRLEVPSNVFPIKVLNNVISLEEYREDRAKQT